MIIGTIAADMTLDINNLTSNAARAEQTLRGLDGAVGGVAGKGMSKMQAFGTVATGLGTVLAAPFAIGLKGAVDFEQAMANTNAALGGVDAGVLDTLGEGFQRIGVESQYSATQVAAVGEELAKAGFNTDEITGATQAVVDLSQATGTDLTTSVRGVVQAMSVWDPALVGAGIGMTDAADAADILTVAANQSSAGVEDIIAGMRPLGPVASSMGVGFDESAAAIAMFTNSGLSGADAGVSLARGLQNLADPTTEAAGLMQELGIQAFDSQGSFIGFPALFTQLQGSMSGMSDQAQLTALSTIFGAEAMDVMGLAILNGADPMEQMIALMAEGGAAADQSALRMDTLGASFGTLKEGIATLLASFVSGLLPGFRLVVDGANSFIDLLMRIPGPIKTIVGAVMGLLVAFAAWTIIPEIITGLGAAIPGLSAGFAGFGAALAAVIPVVLGVAAVAGVLYLAWRTNFLGIQDLVGSVVDGITGFIDDFKSAFDGFQTADAVIDAFGQSLGTVAGYGNTFSNVLAAIGEAIRGIGGGDIGWLNTLADGFEKAAGFIQDFKDAWDSIMPDTVDGGKYFDQWEGLDFQKPGKGTSKWARMMQALDKATGGSLSRNLRSIGIEGTFIANLFSSGKFSQAFGEIGRLLYNNPIADALKGLGASLMSGAASLGAWTLNVGAPALTGWLVDHADDIWNALTDAAGWVWDELVDLGGWTLNTAVPAVSGWIADHAGGVWDALSSAAGWVWDGLVDLGGWTLNTAIPAVSGWIADHAGGVWSALSSAAGWAWDGLVDLGSWTIGTAVPTVGGWIKDIASDVWGGLKRTVNWAWDGAVDLGGWTIGTAVPTVGGWIKDIASDVWAGLKRTVNWAWDGAEDLGDWTLDVAIPNIAEWTWDIAELILTAMGDVLVPLTDMIVRLDGAQIVAGAIDLAGAIVTWIMDHPMAAIAIGASVLALAFFGPIGLVTLAGVGLVVAIVAAMKDNMPASIPLAADALLINLTNFTIAVVGLMGEIVTAIGQQIDANAIPLGLVALRIVSWVIDSAPSIATAILSFLGGLVVPVLALSWAVQVSIGQWTVTDVGNIAFAIGTFVGGLVVPVLALSWAVQVSIGQWTVTDVGNIAFAIGTFVGGLVVPVLALSWAVQVSIGQWTVTDVGNLALAIGVLLGGLVVPVLALSWAVQVSITEWAISASVPILGALLTFVGGLVIAAITFPFAIGVKIGEWAFTAAVDIGTAIGDWIDGALGALGSVAGVTISFAADAFSWPDMPDFEWPTFTWPAYLAFTWPAYLAWAWPALPAFSWPALPTWTWPDIKRPGWLDELLGWNPFGGGDSNVPPDTTGNDLHDEDGMPLPDPGFGRVDFGGMGDLGLAAQTLALSTFTTKMDAVKLKVSELATAFTTFNTTALTTLNTGFTTVGTTMSTFNAGPLTTLNAGFPILAATILAFNAGPLTTLNNAFPILTATMTAFNAGPLTTLNAGFPILAATIMAFNAGPLTTLNAAFPILSATMTAFNAGPLTMLNAGFPILSATILAFNAGPLTTLNAAFPILSASMLAFNAGPLTLLNAGFPLLGATILAFNAGPLTLLNAGFPLLGATILAFNAGPLTTLNAAFPILGATVLAFNSGPLTTLNAAFPVLGATISAFQATATTAITEMAASGAQSFTTLSSTATQAMSQMAASGAQSFSQLSSAASSAMSQMASAASSSFAQVASAASSGMAQATGAVQSGAAQWPGIIGSYSGAMSGAGFSVGAAAGAGVASGLLSQLGAVSSAANSIVSEVNRAMQSAAKIASPSKLTAEIGKQLTAGVAKGMTDAVGMVTKASQDVIAASSRGLNAYITHIKTDGDWLNDALATIPNGDKYGEALRSIWGDPKMRDAARAFMDHVLDDGDYRNDALMGLPAGKIRDTFRDWGKYISDQLEQATPQGGQGPTGAYTKGDEMFGRQRGSLGGAIINGWERLVGGMYRNMEGVIKKGTLVEDGGFMVPRDFGGIGKANANAAGLTRVLALTAKNRDARDQVQRQQTNRATVGSQPNTGGATRGVQYISHTYHSTDDHRTINAVKSDEMQRLIDGSEHGTASSRTLNRARGAAQAQSGRRAPVRT